MFMTSLMQTARHKMATFMVVKNKQNVITKKGDIYDDEKGDIY